MPVLVRRAALGTAVALAFAFACRLAYGLSMPFWSEDERQVYLIGLRAFARGEWPFFGADVVWTGGQVPGAMLGLLVKVPLAIWPSPEAPTVLLNLLSWAALAALAWYLARRMPAVPRWLLRTWLFTLPWTLNFSAHVVNPSYVLAGSVAFFIGFFEGWPGLRRGIVPFGAAWALMGAGLFFLAQIHLSWVLLVPYLIFAAAGVVRTGVADPALGRGPAMGRAAIAFVAGAAVTGWPLVPTLVTYGFDAGGATSVVSPHVQGPFGLVVTAARVLSFASFEINRFAGLSAPERMLLIWEQPWVMPFLIVVVPAGVLHPLWMAVALVRRGPAPAPDWSRVRLLLLATVLLIYASYFWSIRGPQAHSFYVVFPVAALFACACWREFVPAGGRRAKLWTRVAGVVLAANAATHLALAIDRWPAKSLYTDRAVVAAAIARENDRLLGDRRDTVVRHEDHRPRPIDRVDARAYLRAEPQDDLQVVSADWAPVLGRVSRFSVTLDNRSRVAAWIDIRFATTYRDASGRLVDVREGVIKRLIQPGERRHFKHVTDGWVPARATSATFTIVDAERVIPSFRSGPQ